MNAVDPLPPLAWRYVAALLGEEAARALLRSGTKPKDGDIPAKLRGDISFADAWMRMLEYILAQGDESYGQAPRPVPPGQFDLHIGIMCHGTDVRAALRRFVDVSKLVRDDINVEVHARKSWLEVSVCTEGDPDPTRDIYHEVFAVVLHCALRWMTGERITVSHVRAPPLPLGIPNSFVTVLACPIRREGRGVTLYYASEAQRLPILPVKLGRLGAVPIDQFMRELRALREPVVGSIRDPGETGRRVHSILARERLNAPQVAKRLNVSSATLRRRLADEGTSFREIVSSQRRANAEMLLATNQPVADIAVELGFSDERSFRRACLDWFGVGPAQHRRRLLEGHGVVADHV